MTLEGQGDMKKIPISEEGSPVFSIASFLAICAAISTGGRMGKSRGIRVGKRTRMMRTMVGQALLMKGASSRCSSM